MIKVDNMAVKIDGNNDNLLVECTLAVASTVEAIAEGDNSFANATLYAVFMGAVKILHDYHHIDVDTSFIGTEIAKATKE